MGNLLDKRIVQSRNWIDPNATASIPTFDFEFVYPVTVYEAVKRDMDDNSPNLSDEITSIYRLIADKQDVIQGGTPGQIMTWSGIQGQIGVLEVTRSISSDPAIRSNAKVPTERAVGDALDTRASVSALVSHTNDTSIHLTDIERNRWNSMAPLSSLQSHVSNVVMHLTNIERGRWNAKAEATDLDAHVYNTNNPHNVTAHQVGGYTRKEVDDMFATLQESFFNYLNISWDDRSNNAELVKYNSANWNPNYALAFGAALPDVTDATLTYFALIPATDYAVSETNDCIIYIKRPGLAWLEVGSTSLSAGDMIIKYPDTSMYVWMQGRFVRLFSDSGTDTPTDGLNGNVWKPSIDSKGLMSWVLSKDATVPASVSIKGTDGYTPIKGIDYADGKDGEGVPVGGNAGDLLMKLSNDNYGTTWGSLIDVLKNLVLAGTYLPQDIVLWDNIKGKPNRYDALGPNDDGYITQKAATNQFTVVNTQITDILTKVDGPTGIAGIKNDLYDHINDYNNPHRVTPAIIGAVTIATYTDHIQNFNNPHNTTKAQLGLGNVDNTADATKPVSAATQAALDLIKSKLDLINSNLAASKYIVNVNWDNPTNDLIFQFKDGTALSVTIPITDIFTKIHFDDTTKELVIVLPDGTENRINISALIQTYYGSIGANIQVVIENDKIVKASIIPGSIGELEIAPSVNLRSSPTTTTQAVSDRSGRISTTQFVAGQVINNLISYETDRPLSANMGRILDQSKANIADVIQIINDLEGISVIDTLDSTSPLAALSANMGRFLDLTKAPRVHTSPSGSTFGSATISLFGHTRASEDDPLMDGTVFRGTDNGRFARGDHRHPVDITRASSNSPDLTGLPTTTTPPDSSNDNRIADTEWVRRNAVGVTQGVSSTIGSTGVKVVTLQSDFVQNVVFLRQAGSTVVVNFDYTDVSTGVVQLDVQGTGAAPVRYGGLPVIPNMISSHYSHIFTFDGTNWRLLNPAGIQPLDNGDNSNRIVSSEWVRKNTSGVLWGISDTVETTTTKVATIRSSFVANFVFTRQIGSTVVIKFSAGDNSPGVTQLDVQGTGPATIVYESRPIIPYMIDKDLDHIFTFDGTNWRLLNPSLMGTEQFGGNATGATNQMTEYLGFTVEGHGGTTDANGQCNRALFTIPFKTLKPEGSKITISNNVADWAARMGDGNLVDLTDPSLLFSSRGHGVIQFTLAAYYPSNSPCGLVAKRPQASLKIESDSSAIAFVAVADIAIPNSINSGSSQNLSSFNVAPVNATNQNIVWSIVNAGGTGAAINTGILTVTSSGTLTIRATIANGATATTDFVKDYVITVVAASISITSQPVSYTEVVAGNISGSLSVSATVVSGTMSYQWYSNTTNSNVGGTAITGATNSTLSIPTNLAGGDSYFFCEVRATGGATSTRSNVAKVTIKIKATAITISPKPTTLLESTTVQLIGTITPSNTSNTSITWSTSDSSIANVNAVGLLTTTKAGSVLITATIDGVQDVWTLNVVKFVPVSTISNIPTSLLVGQVSVLAPTLAPANATNQTIAWSIIDGGSTSATLVGNTLTVPASGIVTIRAQVDNGQNLGAAYIQDFTIRVDVGYVPVTSIALSQIQGRAGENISLSGVVAPVNATNKTVIWSIKSDSNGTGAIISYNSYLTASTTGVVVITAKIFNGLTKTTDYTQDFNITIINSLIQVQDITNIPVQTAINQSIQLVPTVVPSNSTSNIVTFSIVSDGGTGSTISADSKLSSTVPGTLVIRATVANGMGPGVAYLKDFTINVIPDYFAVTGITFATTDWRLGEVLDLTPQSTLAPTNATNQTIVWSVATDGGTGSTITGGKLTATAMGTVKIRATVINGLTKTTNYVQDFNINITSSFVPITDITCPVSRIFTNIESEYVSFAVVPTNSTYKDISVEIHSDGGTNTTMNPLTQTLLATATGNLVFSTLVANGTAIGTSYVKLIQIVVEVFNKITNLLNIPTSFRLNKTLVLSGDLVPTNASFKTIVWSIVNANGTGATLTSDGTAINTLAATTAGVINVRATVLCGIAPYGTGNSYTKDFTVTVLPIFVPVTSIINSPTSVVRGVSTTLTGALSPANATNQAIVWSIISAGSTGAAITGGNTLTATSIGAITIRATVVNGLSDTSNYTQDYNINIVDPYVPVTGITGIPTSLTNNVATTLTGVIAPSTATNKTIVWSIVSGSATLVGNVVTATAAGAIKLRATIANGATATTNYVQDFDMTAV